MLVGEIRRRPQSLLGPHRNTKWKAQNNFSHISHDAPYSETEISNPSRGLHKYGVYVGEEVYIMQCVLVVSFIGWTKSNLSTTFEISICKRTCPKTGGRWVSCTSLFPLFNAWKAPSFYVIFLHYASRLFWLFLLISWSLDGCKK